MCIVNALFAQTPVQVSQLSCNHFNNPEGVLNDPVFGWKLTSDQNAQFQTAYQIVVSSSLKNSLAAIGDVWDSKKVASANQINIRYRGRAFESSTKYYWRAKVWDRNGASSKWSKPANFITGLLKPDDFKGTWISSNKKKGEASPLFRKSFEISSVPEDAVVHISGLGYYELYVNGKKVGDHVLDPGQTNYDDYAFYVTYNIDTLLRKGQNVIGVMLGDGFYNQDVVWGGGLTYGPPLFWLQLNMQLNGAQHQIISDTSWKFANGPILSSNVYAGEVYDATKEITGWASVGLDEQNWKNVFPAKVHPPKLVPQSLQAIKKMAKLEPKKVFKTASGTYIFDFGQNFTGWNRLKVQAPKGTEISLKMAEELYPDSSLNVSTTGIYATKVVQEEKYITKGEGKEIWEPRFTYHGYRYVEVTGLTGAPTSDLLTGVVVHSAMPKVGNFQCSNPQINKLHELSYWTIIGNMHSIPTDCPHREKCGWLGDAHAMAPSTIYNLDMEGFWLKFIDDIHSTARLAANVQRHTGIPEPRLTKFTKPAGLPYMIAPGKRLPAVASPDWGTAIVQLPWFIYTYYGNLAAIEKYYPDMKQWVGYVGSLAKDHIVYQGLGDWCPPGGVKYIDCPIALSSTAFHYNDLVILQKTAGILGKRQDSIVFADSAARVKQAFVQKFYDPVLKSFGSHTANALALDFGLVPVNGQKSVADAIVTTSNQKFGGFMFAGIFGLQRIFGQLSNNGNEQAAYTILNKKGDNSFEFMWKNYGATTLWEVLPVSTLAPDDEDLQRRSHNHPMQAGFDAFFFDGVGGIKPIISAPGFKKMILEPKLINQLQWAKTDYNSIYGKVVSNWKMEGKRLLWQVEIPVNTSAEIVLPAQFSEMKINNGKAIKINKKEAQFKYPLQAGKYQLSFN